MWVVPGTEPRCVIWAVGCGPQLHFGTAHCNRGLDSRGYRVSGLPVGQKVLGVRHLTMTAGGFRPHKPGRRGGEPPVRALQGCGRGLCTRLVVAHVPTYPRPTQRTHAPIALAALERPTTHADGTPRARAGPVQGHLASARQRPSGARCADPPTDAPAKASTRPRSPCVARSADPSLTP